MPGEDEDGSEPTTEIVTEPVDGPEPANFPNSEGDGGGEEQKAAALRIQAVHRGNQTRKNQRAAVVKKRRKDVLGVTSDGSQGNSSTEVELQEGEIFEDNISDIKSGIEEYITHINTRFKSICRTSKLTFRTSGVQV